MSRGRRSTSTFSPTRERGFRAHADQCFMQAERAAPEVFVAKRGVPKNIATVAKLPGRVHVGREITLRAMRVKRSP